jgi:hypothetical protein
MDSSLNFALLSHGSLFCFGTSREAREKLKSVHTLKKLLEHPPKFDAQELYRRVT